MSIICEEFFDEVTHPSEEEVKDYALKIGIDPDSEPQLLPIAAEGLMKALPPGWKPWTRTANFSRREEKILLSLIRKYRSTIENPKCDGQTNQQKNNCWKLIENQFNYESSDLFRDDKTLRRKYDNVKSNVKKRLRSKVKIGSESIQNNEEFDFKLKELVEQEMDKLASSSEMEYSGDSCSDSDADTGSNAISRTPNTTSLNTDHGYYLNAEVKEEVPEADPFQEDVNGDYQTELTDIEKKSKDRESKYRKRYEEGEHKLRMELIRKRHEVEIELMKKESEVKISGIELQTKAALHYIKNEHLLKMEILELEKRNLAKQLGQA